MISNSLFLKKHLKIAQFAGGPCISNYMNSILCEYLIQDTLLNNAQKIGSHLEENANLVRQKDQDIRNAC